MRFPLVGKVAALGAVTVSLFVALGMVGDVVAEREGRLREAQRSVADSLASSQTLIGPVLHRHCVESWEVTQGDAKDRKVITESRDITLRAAPHQLGIDASVSIETRHRGIFKVNGYLTKAVLNADWPSLASLQPRASRPNTQLRCDAPVLMVGVSDARGVRSARVSIDGSERPVAPGSALPGQPRGFHVVLQDIGKDDVGNALPTTALATQIELELVGTEALAFAPVADATEVKLTSDWPHPSFGGRFLPAQREVSDQGFTATWRLSALASSAQQEWLAGGAVCDGGGSVSPAAADEPPSTRHACIETFGVDFIDPVSPYALSDRATKYGVLFIVLTFVAVGLVEVIRRLRVHPIQYLLVGCALVVFFLLLVSLTEHLPFGGSYLAASGACTLLLGYYGRHVLRSRRAGALFGAAIGAIYAALYVLLQMEQTALLIGSVLLFSVIAAVMVATRRLDWYALVGAPSPQPGAKGVA